MNVPPRARRAWLDVDGSLSGDVDSVRRGRANADCGCAGDVRLRDVLDRLGRGRILLRGARLELWAELGLIVFGVLLVLAAAFVRVRLPGGLAFAIGAMLGLQALAVHDAVHLGTGVRPQLASGVSPGLARLARRTVGDSAAGQTGRRSAVIALSFGRTSAASTRF